ncbi:hypothetical protein [Streptomyces flaveus]|uniref:hypothetical protein n=1 Tax=Streptomyces flaveus TaxID=66370 RepID=UPI00332A4632
MSVGSRGGKPRAQGRGRSLAGNIAFGTGAVLVLTTIMLGGYAGAALTHGLADDSFLSSAVPDDGRVAVITGGVGMGSLMGLMLPLLLLAAVRGTKEKPRLGPGEALLKALGVVVIGVYLAVVSLLPAQLGWILPERVVSLLSVPFVGFSWVPLVLIPWGRFGLGGTARLRVGSRGRGSSNSA